MSRAFLITMLTGAFLAMPAFVPATTTGLSGSALAQKPSTTPTTDATNLNSSRSNIYRMGGGPGKKAGTNRMGGGPGKKSGSTP
jgi:hypothetical protein